MRIYRISEHPNEETLLAYVDGELSNARVRAVRNHLTSCWTCRSVLADLESQAEAVSRLLFQTKPNPTSTDRPGRRRDFLPGERRLKGSVFPFSGKDAPYFLRV